MASIKILKPIQEDPSDYDRMEDKILENWKINLYLPLIKLIDAPTNVLQNSSDDIVKAIKDGRIRFNKGQFTGRFNSLVTREMKKIGAVWDRKQGSFKIPYGKLSTGMKTAISLSEDKWNRTIDKLDKLISAMSPAKIAEKVQIEDLFNTTLLKMDEKIRGSMRAMTVTPELSRVDRAKIAKDYTNNMKLYIQEWTQKEIKTLRKEVMVAAQGGNRYETLVKDIQRRYQVSQSKAKFLARQETSILMSEFKKVRYQAAGVEEYIWGVVVGSAKSPVRPMHKKLEGRTFRWDDPPVVNGKGDKKNPGCDYGCRCFAKPIVKF